MIGPRSACEDDFRMETHRPGCILFLIDLSGSMRDVFDASTGKTKAEVVADSINDTLNEILQNNVIVTETEMSLKERVTVGLMGYGANPDKIKQGKALDLEVFNLLGGKKLFYTLSELSEKHVATEETEDGVEKLLWLKPHVGKSTPMRTAFNLALPYLKKWNELHPDSCPPIVINITDGELTDCPHDGPDHPKFVELLDEVKKEALVFNCHITEQQVQPVRFPETAPTNLEKYAELLFKCSSRLPSSMRLIASNMFGVDLPFNSRGYIFNASAVDLVKFITFATTPTQSRASPSQRTTPAIPSRPGPNRGERKGRGVPRWT